MFKGMFEFTVNFAEPQCITMILSNSLSIQIGNKKLMSKMHCDKKAHPCDVLAASRSNICIIMKVIFTPATAKGYSKTTPFLPCFIKRF